MRIAALSCVAFGLAACGGSQAGDVVAPVLAPDGSGDVVQAFFKVCGTALNEGDVVKALPTAAKLGWELEADLGKGVGPIDIMRTTMVRNHENDHMIQFSEHDGQHMKLMSCQLIGGFGDDALQIDPKIFGALGDFDGRSEAYLDQGVVGHWSQRNGNAVLAIFTTANEDFSTVVMNKTILK